MGKYNVRQASEDVRPWKIHPIWRAFGCITVVVGPPVAFVLAHLLVNMNLDRGWYAISKDLRAPFTLPGIQYTVPHFLASLLLSVLIMLIGAATIVLIYSLIYAVLGPKRYGGLDAEPVRRSGNKKNKLR